MFLVKVLRVSPYQQYLFQYLKHKLELFCLHCLFQFKASLSSKLKCDNVFLAHQCSHVKMELEILPTTPPPPPPQHTHKQKKLYPFQGMAIRHEHKIWIGSQLFLGMPVGEHKIWMGSYFQACLSVNINIPTKL